MRTIKISFQSTASIHRIRNFGEELSLSLGELGVLPMDAADSATDSLEITHVHRRHIGQCRAFITKMLKKHHLDGEAKFE